MKKHIILAIVLLLVFSGSLGVRGTSAQAAQAQSQVKISWIVDPSEGGLNGWYKEGDTVSAAIEAYVVNGNVSQSLKVSLYRDSVLVGYNITSADNHVILRDSFQVTQSTREGQHYYKVVVVYNAETVQEKKNFSVDNTPPEASVESPEKGAYVHDTIPINVTVSDTMSGVASVEWYIDGVPVHEEQLNNEKNAELSYLWDTTKYSTGQHSVYVKAMDFVGHETTSNVVSVIVDNVKPIIYIESPKNDAYVSNSVKLEAVAEDNYRVDSVAFYLDGLQGPCIGKVSAEPYEIDWNTTATGTGNHIIYAVAEDEVGNKGVAFITLYIDNTGPQVSIESPKENEVLSGVVDIVIQASDRESGIKEVRVYNDSESPAHLIGVLSTEPYRVRWNTENTYDGLHSLIAVAENQAGLISRVKITVGVNNEPPEIAISGVKQGEYVDGTVYLNITANDENGVKSIEILIDGVEVANYQGQSRVTYLWQTTAFEDGMHDIEVVAEDSLGNEKSVSIEVYTDNTPPGAFSKISVDGHYGNGTVLRDRTPAFTWSVSAGAEGYYFVLSTSSKMKDVVYRYTLPAGGTSFRIPDKLHDGRWYWGVIAFDRVGHEVMADNSLGWFVIDTQPPKLLSCTISPHLYSPNGDGKNDVLWINATAGENVTWDVKIRYENGALSFVFPEVTSAVFKGVYGLRGMYGDGTYYVVIVIRDQAGNSNATRYSFIQDTTPPKAPAGSVHNGQEYKVQGDESKEIRIAWPAPLNDSWMKDEVVIYDSHGKVVKSEVFTTVMGNEFSVTVNLKPGEYHYKILRFDKAGNMNATKSIYFSIVKEEHHTPIAGIVVILIVIILVIVFVLGRLNYIHIPGISKPREEKKLPGEALSEYEVAILQEVKNYLERNKGSAEYKRLVDAVSKKLNVSKEDVKLVIQYAKERGVLAVEVDSENISHVTLVTSKVEFEEEKKEVEKNEE